MPSKKKQHVVRLSPEAEAKLPAWLGGMKISERVERAIMGSSIPVSRMETRILIEEARGLRAEIRRTGAMVRALLQSAQLSELDRTALFSLCGKILATAEEIRIDPFWDTTHDEDKAGEESDANPL